MYMCATIGIYVPTNAIKAKTLTTFTTELQVAEIISKKIAFSQLKEAQEVSIPGENSGLVSCKFEGQSFN